MLRIAYCQISAHPAYCGANGNFCREPVYDAGGAVLTETSQIGTVNEICDKIYGLYTKKFCLKIQHLLQTLKREEIDILVFPEYTVPAECLPLLYEFCQSQNCICIAASHTVQQIHQPIYKSINLNIGPESNNFSCCPVIFPDGKTEVLFKHYKSKWEANMGVEEYPTEEKSFAFICKDQKVTVLLCIDALHIDVDEKKTDVVIVAAASPSDGLFGNKFENYVSKEIPTIFCNFYLYGKSTIYASLPKNTNVEYAEKTHITKTGAKEEVVVIAEINTDCQATKVHTINPTVPVNVCKVLPILYRDDNSEQKLWSQLKHFAQIQDYCKLDSCQRAFVQTADGIISQKKKYLCTGIHEQTLFYPRIVELSDFIYINDFSLKHYEINWLEKSINRIMEEIKTAKIKFEDINAALSKLMQTYQALLPQIPEKLDIPVFDENIKSSSVFQNRGGEIQKFRDQQQNGNTTLFIVQSFPQIGKSAFIDQLKFRFSFNVINCPMPKGGGFESLIRWVCEIAKAPLDWENFDEVTIEKYVNYFSQYLNNLNKTIVVFRRTGNLFDEYNGPKATLFFTLLASKLHEMDSGIKVIIEHSRRLSPVISQHPNIYVCTLKPLYDLYIERLIEQTANNIMYSFSLPQIPSNSVYQCHGNPAIARMIGIYIGQKINQGENIEISKDDMDTFLDQYTDGILSAISATPEEKELLNEIAVYRLPVPKEAFEKLPHFTNERLSHLVEKLLVEEIDQYFDVNSFIATSLRMKAVARKDLHEIAAQYYENLFTRETSYIAKAEQLFHASFSPEKIKLRENLRYYANDIFSASIDLINMGEVEIAHTHLDSICHFQSAFNSSEFYFYYSLCYIFSGEYDKYREFFEKAVAHRSENQDVLYYRMIDRLIKSRFLNEAENLLNEVCEKYTHTRQMDALWVAYKYATNKTRNDAINAAMQLTRNSAGDFYSAKILVRIYLKEGMIDEALTEVKAVQEKWPKNRWAPKMEHIISMGKYQMDAEEDEINSDEEFERD